MPASAATRELPVTADGPAIADIAASAYGGELGIPHRRTDR